MRSWCFVLMLLMTGNVLAQNRSGEISGTVQDENGLALPGATIQLFGDRGKPTPYNTTADNRGVFKLVEVPFGGYEMRTSFIGFAMKTTLLSLSANLVLNITLSSTTLPVNEVIVTSGRATSQLSPVTISNISAEDLARQPDMKDLPVHLARQPSITFHSENGNAIGYSTLRMRGFDQRRLAVAINGIPQNDPEEFNVFWINFFDIQGAIQDIQIQRGAGASVYGPTAIGGAINIRAFPYKPDFYGSVQVGGGAFGTRRYSVEVNSGLFGGKPGVQGGKPGLEGGQPGLQGGQYVVYGRLSRLLSEGYRDWSWTKFWRFFGGITRYGPRSTITLQAYGGPQRDGLAYSGIPKAANEATIDDGFGGSIDRKYNFSSFERAVEDFHQPHVELHHSLDFSSDWQFEQTAFWMKGEGYFDFGGTFRSANYLRLPAGFVDASLRADPLFISRPDVSLTFRAYLDQWQIGWMPRITNTTEKSTSSAGLEFRLHRSLRWGRIQDGTGLPSNLVGTENDVRVYSIRGEKTIVSAYASHLTRVSELWAVQADAQLTTRQYRIWDEAFFGTEFSKPYLFFNPRLGVTYRPEKAVSGYASIALASREPRMKNLYDGEEAGEGFEPLFERDNDGDFNFDRPFVKPEHLLDIETGVTAKGKRFRASANVFLMDFRDELVPSGGLDQYGVPRTGNADHTRHVGLELDGSMRLARGWDVAGNLTLSRNRYLSFDEFVTGQDFSVVAVSRDGNTIAGFPNRSGNLRLSYFRGGFSSSFQSSLVGRQFIENSNGAIGENGGAGGLSEDDFIVDPFILVDASVRYSFQANSALSGLHVSLDLNNVFDQKALTYGQVSFGTPEFFPAATRHAFFSMKYMLK